jgi:DNA polymerase-4
VTARKRRAIGVRTLTDVRSADTALLRSAVGSLAGWLQQLARGVDDRPVINEHAPKSSGSETTFAADLTDIEEIRSSIARMASDAAAWLERRQLYARTVSIKVRYDDFTTVTRSHTDLASRDESSIAARAVALLSRTEAGARPVRLLGVSVHNLTSTDDEPPRRARAAAPLPTLPFEE